MPGTKVKKSFFTLDSLLKGELVMPKGKQFPSELVMEIHYKDSQPSAVVSYTSASAGRIELPYKEFVVHARKFKGMFMSFGKKDNPENENLKLVAAFRNACEGMVDQAHIVSQVKFLLALRRKLEVLSTALSAMDRKDAGHWPDFLNSQIKAVYEYIAKRKAALTTPGAKYTTGCPDTVVQWFWKKLDNVQGLNTEAKKSLAPCAPIKLDGSLLDWIYPARMENYPSVLRTEVDLLNDGLKETMKPFIANFDASLDAAKAIDSKIQVGKGVTPTKESRYFAEAKIIIPAPVAGRTSTTSKELNMSDFVNDKRLDTSLRKPAVVNPLKVNYFMAAFASGQFPRDRLATGKENNVLRTVYGAAAYDERLDKERVTMNKEDILRSINTEVKLDAKALRAAMSPDDPCGIALSGTGIYEPCDKTLGKDLIASVMLRNNVELPPFKVIWEDADVAVVPCQKETLLEPSKDDIDRARDALPTTFPKREPKKESGARKEPSTVNCPVEAKQYYTKLSELGENSKVIKTLKIRAGKSLHAHITGVLLCFSGEVGDPSDDLSDSDVD